MVWDKSKGWVGGGGGVCGVGGWGGMWGGWVGGGGKGWVGGGGGWVGGGWGGLPPLPTHPPLRFTREQTRVEYIRRCRLKIEKKQSDSVYKHSPIWQWTKLQNLVWFRRIGIKI